ncbi:hypothetical protein [Cohnella sp.]|uniref:hypothetical protein n=1 Tax=Cohnella sp. TaxID=1883426 RepID=UPI003564E05A
MRAADEIDQEIRNVVKALERDGLSREQRDRGWKRYDELQAEAQAAYRGEAEAYIQSIRGTLESKGAKSPSRKRA